MAKIILRPRTSSVVTPSSSTSVSTTAGQNLVSTTATSAAKKVNFTKADIEGDSQTLAEKLMGVQQEIHSELASLRGFPFTRGVLLKDQVFYGAMGQIDTITTYKNANDAVTLWRPYDAKLFDTGFIVRAATSDGKSRATIRTGSATVFRPGYLNTALTVGTVINGSSMTPVSWLTSIPTLGIGDWLFRVNPKAPNTATDTTWFLNAKVTIAHGLGLTPRWFWVAGTQKGASPPELTVAAADQSTITFVTSRYSIADIFVCA